MDKLMRYAERVKRYKNRTDLLKRNPALYREIMAENLMDEVMPRHDTHGAPEKWTFDRVKAEAMKYTTRGAFHLGCSGAYLKAMRAGWLDMLFTGREEEREYPVGRTEKRWWTEAEVRAEADKYETRSQFSVGSPSAYKQARLLDMMDELFKPKERARMLEELRNAQSKTQTSPAD